MIYVLEPKRKTKPAKKPIKIPQHQVSSYALSCILNEKVKFRERDFQRLKRGVSEIFSKVQNQSI
jgi:hypothetical protein